MSPSLSILHLVDKNRLTTGSVVQMMAAARGLAEREHRVWVGGPAGGDLETACAAAGLQFIDLPLGGIADPNSVLMLRRHLQHYETDILHVHKGRAHAVGLAAATGVGHRPRLVVNRGVTFDLDILNKWKYRHPRVGAIVCVADAVREAVIRTGDLGRARVHTVYGGTDTNVFKPEVGGQDLRRELGVGRTHLLIGQVSVRDWKGWAELVVAFHRIAPEFPDARLLLVGCEPEHELTKVEKAVNKAALDGLVVALPYRMDMPEVLGACDVVVDASWNGTGITGTIREAMALARAVVATDCGGNAELVIDGEVGLLVPPRDIGALAGALTTLLEDPALRRRLGMAARRRVVEHFSTDRRIDQLEALYRKVLADVCDGTRR